MLDWIENVATLATWALLFCNAAVLGLAAIAEFAPPRAFTGSLRRFHQLFTTPMRAACFHMEREEQNGGTDGNAS